MPALHYGCLSLLFWPGAAAAAAGSASTPASFFHFQFCCPVLFFIFVYMLTYPCPPHEAYISVIHASLPSVFSSLAAPLCLFFLLSSVVKSNTKKQHGKKQTNKNEYHYTIPSSFKTYSSYIFLSTLSPRNLFSYPCIFPPPVSSHSFFFSSLYSITCVLVLCTKIIPSAMGTFVLGDRSGWPLDLHLATQASKAAFS